MGIVKVDMFRASLLKMSNRIKFGANHVESIEQNLKKEKKVNDLYDFELKVMF